MRRALLENLLLLDAPDSLLDQYQHQWSNPRTVDNLLHYLFSVITTPRELKKRLGSSWPIHDAIGSKDFRTACFKWAEQLRQEGQLPAGLPLRKSFFDDACGERFEDVLAWISVLGIKNQLSGATHESDNKFLNPSVPLKGEKEVNEFKDALNAKVASLHHQCNLFSEQKRKYELLAEYASGAELSAETTNDPVFLEAFKSIPPVSHEGDGFQSLDQQVKQLKEHINAHYSQPFTDRREELKASLQSLHAEYEENLLTNRRLRHEIEATMSKLKCVPTKPNDPPQGPTINPAILEKLFSWELINPKPAKAASLPFADVTGDFLVE